MGGNNALGSGPEEEQFCLRWNDFQESLLTTLQSLRDEESLVDVTLLCASDRGAGHVAMKAHRLILSACSDVFKNILAKIQSPNPVIVLWEVAGSDLRRILRFMYHGEVEVQQTHLEPFLAVAEKLRVRGLCQGTPINNETSIRSDSAPESENELPEGESNGKKAKKRRRRRSGHAASDSAIKVIKDEHVEDGEEQSRDSLPAIMAPQTSLTEGSSEPGGDPAPNEGSGGNEEDGDNNCDENSGDNNSSLINLPGFPRTPQGGTNSGGNGNFNRSESSSAMQLPPPHLMGMNLGSPLDPSTAKGLLGSSDLSSPPSGVLENRGPKFVFTKVQQNLLEQHFLEDPYPSRPMRVSLANALEVREFQVKNWFQNRRSRGKQRGEMF